MSRLVALTMLSVLLVFTSSNVVVAEEIIQDNVTQEVVRVQPSSRGERVARIASEQVGKPYVWGSAGPDSFDCSGLARYAFSQVGVSVPHYVLYIATLPKVEGELLPGDLVLFANTSVAGLSHVGIYLGDNRFIHSMSPDYGTIVSTLLNPYWQQHYVGAVRP